MSGQSVYKCNLSLMRSADDYIPWLTHTMKMIFYAARIALYVIGAAKDTHIEKKSMEDIISLRGENLHDPFHLVQLLSTKEMGRARNCVIFAVDKTVLYTLDH